MDKITSIKDDKVIQARDLNKPSKRENLFLLENKDIILWAINAGIDILHVFVCDKFLDDEFVDQILMPQKLKIFSCGEGIMKKILDSKYLSPFIALAKIGEQELSNQSLMIPVMCDLQDQGNIGTLIRTAKAFGINDCALLGRSRDIYNKKTITASRGSVFKIKPHRYKNDAEAIAALKKKGYQIVATSPHANNIQSQAKLESKPIALLIGNETTGLSSEAMAEADITIQIPMSEDVESLNVGVSTGISLYELKIKVILSMLTKQIHGTIGRNLGVTHKLIQAVFAHELKKVSALSAQQVILMMVMHCDESMSDSDIAQDFSLQIDEVVAFIKPLLDEDMLSKIDDSEKYRLTKHGEKTLAELWSVLEVSNEKALSGITDEERELLDDLLARIQKNCEAVISWQAV